MSMRHITIERPVQATGTACVQCGQRAVYVAELLDSDNEAVGTTIVCTSCSGAHHRS